MAALAWAVAVLAVYYRQLWRLLLGSNWQTLGVEVIPARAFIAGVLFLLAAFAAFLLLALHRPGPRLGRRETFALVGLLMLGLGLYGIVNLLAAEVGIVRTLPYAGAALRRELTGSGSALLLVLAAIALGLGISRVAGWRYANWRECIPFAAALGMGSLAYGGLALALAGLYRPWVLQAVVALVLLGAILAVLLRYRGGWRNGAGPLATLPAPQGAARIWVACTALALLCAGIAALAPESEYDALWYHLSYPQRYLAAGHLVDITHDFVSLYPMTAELWFGYGLALGGAPAAVLLHFACLPLIALLTYELAHRYAPTASPWLAVAITVTAPTLLWEATTANTDLVVMLFMLLALYALLRCLALGELRGVAPAGAAGLNRWLLLAAVNLGFALAVKHSALFALAILCPMLLLARLQQRAGWRKALAAALLLGVVSLLIAMPWYVRSYLATGNPVFERLYGVFGAPPERWNAVMEQGVNGFLGHFGRPRTLLNLLTLPWDMTIHATRYGGSLGPLLLILLPTLWLRRLRGVMGWLIAFAGLFTLLWASPVASFQVRHLLPVVPVLAVLAASAFGRATALGRAVGQRHAPAVLVASLGALLVLNLPPFTFLHEVDRVAWDGWIVEVLHTLPLPVVIGSESTDAYLARKVHFYPVWKFAEANLPADARVLAWSGGQQFDTHYTRIWANAAPAVGITWAKAGQEQQALSGLRKLGITHLIIDKRPPGSKDAWDLFALTQPEVRARRYEKLYEDNWYVLYRIRWETLNAEAPSAAEPSQALR